MIADMRRSRLLFFIPSTSWEDDYDPTSDNTVYTLYTDGQKQALAFISYFVSLPSLLASLTIIYIILRDYGSLVVFHNSKNNKATTTTTPQRSNRSLQSINTATTQAATTTSQPQHFLQRTIRSSSKNLIAATHHHKTTTRTSTIKSGVYIRLLFGLSCMEVLFSFAVLCLGSWVVPVNSHLAYGERGTIATCTTAGIFLTMKFGSILYSACMALYHALLVRFQVSEITMSKYWEPWFHFISIAFPIAVATMAVIKQRINPLHVLSGYCWMGDSPPRCTEINTVDCQRGDGFTHHITGTVNLIFYGGSFLTITICMILIVLKVRATELKLRQYTAKYYRNAAKNVSGGAHSGFSTNTTTRGTSSIQPQQRQQQLTLTKTVGKQGLMYVGSFFLCYIWLVVISQLTHRLPTTKEYRNVYFPLALLVKFFIPLQGTFNLWIFLQQHSNWNSNNKNKKNSNDNSNTTNNSNNNNKNLTLSAIPNGNKGEQQNDTEIEKVEDVKEGENDDEEKRIETTERLEDDDSNYECEYDDDDSCNVRHYHHFNPTAIASSTRTPSDYCEGMDIERSKNTITLFDSVQETKKYKNEVDDDDEEEIRFLSCSFNAIDSDNDNGSDNLETTSSLSFPA